ncbi:DUF4390 domain-containing protein [Duganella sp. FT109W]|uniref:DUF4390 domain-containing protein n=1 Tax=Duganella margarita TaxID=2692170 RepID=A0A7X4GWU8_9BURK|nr:DUF4390 domain-containing protein [Duganella margarita]MYM70591.1 DUF4390 domain-containing protein [Duganella margarita]MYN42963.1 DUF4390 domain-containing protein [Duganella margarita]
MRNLLSTGPHVTRRLFRFLLASLLLTLALLALLPQPAHAAEGVEIRRALVEATEDGYRLSATYGFELSHEMEDALQYGKPLYFYTEIEFTRPRWYWFDEKAITARQTVSLSYNVLTRQYNVAVSGSVHQSFSSLEDALFLIRRPNRWLVAPRGALKVGENYTVKLSMGLDPNYVPKPLKVNALNNSEWRLASDKRTFVYKAE